MRPLVTGAPLLFGCWFALSPALVACSDDANAPTCPGISNPTELELSDLTPALGASVPNDAIVHSFTVTGDIAFDSITFAVPKAHTAGAATPDLALMFRQTSAGTEYVADPVTWEATPAHVEILAPVVYETTDGCGFRLPSPLFSYDVTVP